MICRKCGKNMGKTTEKERIAGSVFGKKCPVCGTVNRRIYNGYKK